MADIMYVDNIPDVGIDFDTLEEKINRPKKPREGLNPEDVGSPTPSQNGDELYQEPYVRNLASGAGNRLFRRVPLPARKRLVEARQRYYVPKAAKKGESTARTHSFRVAGCLDPCTLDLHEKAAYFEFLEAVWRSIGPLNCWLSNGVDRRYRVAAWADFDWNKNPRVTAAMKTRADELWAEMWNDLMGCEVKQLRAVNPYNNNVHYKVCVSFPGIVNYMPGRENRAYDVVKQIIEHFRGIMQENFPDHFSEAEWRELIDASVAVRNLWFSKIESKKGAAGVHTADSFYAPDCANTATPDLATFQQVCWDYDLINTENCIRVDVHPSDCEAGEQFTPLEQCHPKLDQLLLNLPESRKPLYNPTVFPETVIIDGQEVPVTEELLLRFADTYKLRRRHHWYSFSTKFKSLDTDDAPVDVYEIWDSICRRFDGYDEEDNRRRWERMEYEPDGFQKLVDFVGRRLIEAPGTQAVERRFRRVMAENHTVATSVAGVKPDVTFNEEKVAAYQDKEGGGVFACLMRILLLVSAMGTGKTESLRECIRAQPDDVSILMLSPKVALANSFYSSYKDMGFELYNDPKFKGKKLACKRLICQVESIHRIDIAKTGPFDILILDESELITAQFTSDLSRDPNGSYKVLNYIMRESGRIICCDALMGEWTMGLLSTYGYKRSDAKIFLNTYQNDEDVETICCREQAEVIDYLLSDIAGPVGKNAVVACAHKKDAIGLAALCAAEVGIDKVLLITGDSDQAVKNTAGNCNEEWIKYRVVIYTNSIECGVSFTEDHFHRFYGLFSNAAGPSHKSYMQMIKRVRCLRDNRRYIHINDVPLNLAVDMQTLELQIQLPYFVDRLKLPRSMLLHDLTRSNTYVYPFKANNPLYQLTLLNMLANHRSRRNFTANLLNCLRETGTILDMTADARTDEERATGKPAAAFAVTRERFAKARALMQEKEWKAIVDADLAEIANIERTLGEDGQPISNLTTEQARAIRKEAVLNLLEIKESQLSAADVAFFEKPERKRAWRNLKDLIRSKTKDDYLNAKRVEPEMKILGPEYRMRDLEQDDTLKVMMTTRPAWRIEAALGFIRSCGWKMSKLPLVGTNDYLWQVQVLAEQVKRGLRSEFMRQVLVFKNKPLLVVDMIQVFNPPDRESRRLKPAGVHEAKMQKLLPMANFCLAELCLRIQATDNRSTHYVLQKLIDHPIRKHIDPVEAAFRQADLEEFTALGEQPEPLIDDLDD